MAVFCRHFDPFKDHWSMAYTKSNMPWAKERHAMVAYKGSILVLGGKAATVALYLTGMYG